MSSFPAAQNSIAANSNKSSGTGAQSVRGQQSVWGLPAPGTSARRGLTPLSTNLGSSGLESSGSGRLHNTASPSPFTPSFSSVLNSSNTNDHTRNTYSSVSSSFTPQAGSQQAPPGQLLLSPRSRAITPSSNPHSASSAAASTTASQGGGGGGGSGGGGSLRTQTFSPSLQQYGLSSPTNNTFDRSPYTGSNSSSAASGQSSVSKIVVTQVFLLLGSITEKEGKAKWVSQAENIHKLVESNGMEVYSKYLRRLIVGNSPQIFPGTNRNVENPSNYQLLVQEMEKITQDPEQAPRIAEIIDNSEGDIFRDFDLSTFINHFDLGPLAKTLLASAFTHVSRSDLKAKAGAILSNNRDDLFSSLANAQNDSVEVSPSLLATCAIKFLEDLPQSNRNDLDSKKLVFALKHRYSKQGLAMPAEIISTLVLIDLLELNYPLVRGLQLRGPQVTSSLGAAKEFLSQYRTQEIVERPVAAALLFMALTPARQQYSPAIFMSAVTDPFDAPYWQTVIQELDIKGLEISKDQFLIIFNALLPVAQENNHVDMQRLWGGQWRNPSTQLSFLRSFLSCSSEELDATVIPDLRSAYDPQESTDGPEDVVQYADIAQHDSMISLDAVMAVYDLLVRPDEPSTQEEHMLLADTVGTKEGLFLCSSMGIERPWSEGQQNVMKTLLNVFLRDDRAEGAYVLHTLWKQDKQWVATTLMEIHMNNPLELVGILHRAQEHEWLEDLFTMISGFGTDLAALAHRKGLIDINQWAEDKLTQDTNALVTCITKFLVLKAQDEIRTARDEQPVPRTVSLSLKTVRDLLGILDHHQADRSELKALQRQCLQAWPRLIIDSEGRNQSLDVDCKQSNRLSRAADQEMSDLYRRMYNAELKVESVLEYLQECKASQDPAKLDTFACMIHGLFDEFSCFGEYPLGPLATTAVLFGGIISVGLITDLALRIGQEMILDSVRDYPPEASMYKFGLQALLHILERLKEPEWRDYCCQLVQIPGLRGTEPYRVALQVFTENGASRVDGDEANINGMADGLPNGDIDSFLSSDTIPQFKSINAEPASAYDDPDEDIQEKVVFFFNNVSEQNLKSKLAQLQEALQQIHPQWFASFLVEGRAKVEPNYQPLYLDILNLLNNKTLWNEVLRESYVSVKKLLNAESTMQSASERKNLKNLSAWLGSLTVARDKPIKHKNISFLDLLIEGYETQRLSLVIPFTCNVLVQGTKSVVFKPPNPWIVEIMATLLELYMHFDIKLNHKFEIEVLFKEFGSNMTPGSESDNIRNRPLHDEALSDAMLPDGPEGFEDLTLGTMNRTVRNPRFEIDSLSTALPDLESVLVFPPATGSSANQAKLREIVQEAVKRAILEIIGPVVERSVTIATIATSALIHKDFAREMDEDRIRRSAQQMVRQLSGSLALVTCKEPLKMSMTNYIRMAQAELPDQAFPEGAILMCVNDNLDTACNIVEKQAEEQSMPEIEAHIEVEIAARRQHRISNPNESFQDSAFSHWSQFIPEPYKQSFNGLNQEQMAIYLDFARQSRGPGSHGQSVSIDSGRQLPDVLQDAFASVPSSHTPAVDLPIPHQPQQQQQQQLGRMLPPPIPNTMHPNQGNGYMDFAAIQGRMQSLLADISQLIKEKPEKSMSDLPDDLPAVVENLNQAWDIIESSPDVAMQCAGLICKAILAEFMTRLEVEVFVHLLARVCQVYQNIRKEVAVWATSQVDTKQLNVDVTTALVKTHIMSMTQVDTLAAGLFYDRIEGAVEFLSDLLDALLLNDRPVALRGDFANSLGALGQWLTENPTHQSAIDLVQKLKDWGVRQIEDATLDEQSLVRKRQLQYIFSEWTAICSAYPKAPTDDVYTAFIFQLHQRQLLNSEEDMATFLRLCIDDGLESYVFASMDTEGNSNEALIKVDWLARLIVALVKNQGEQDGAVRLDKAAYMSSMLAIINLVINNHQVTHGERFNQRVFFRLLSSILCDWHDLGREGLEQDRDILIVFAENFKALSPRHFPALIYSWLMLISHRLFMPSLLKLGNDQGWGSFLEIMEDAIWYICQFLKTNAISPLGIDLYRGLLRIVLILHHDFPEFLAENHFRLCNSIPRHCTQLHNLVLSAYPSSFPELPNPFVIGLKVDRLEEMRKEPRVTDDYTSLLSRAGITTLIDASLKGQGNCADELVARLVSTAQTATGRNLVANSSLLHALVLYIGQHAVVAAGQKPGPAFTTDSPQGALLTKLAKELQPDARYFYFCAMVNQLRYPNSHTQYFSYALLHLFGAVSEDQQDSDVREQIIRVLLERLHVVKPHPWGLVITMLELIKNQDYGFFQLSFVKSSKHIREMCEDLRATAQERERWSEQFTPHI